MSTIILQKIWNSTYLQVLPEENHHLLRSKVEEIVKKFSNCDSNLFHLDKCWENLSWFLHMNYQVPWTMTVNLNPEKSLNDQVTWIIRYNLNDLVPAHKNAHMNEIPCLLLGINLANALASLKKAGYRWCFKKTGFLQVELDTWSYVLPIF